MEHELYRTQPDANIDPIVEELRKAIADKTGNGITVQGNRMTVRWYRGKNLVSVHMIIVSVEDGEYGDEDQTESH